MVNAIYFIFILVLAAFAISIIGFLIGWGIMSAKKAFIEREMKRTLKSILKGEKK